MNPKKMAFSPMPDGWGEEINPSHDVLTSNSTETDRHYEEAGSVGEEMKLMQEKMGMPYFLKEQAD